jgi:hypothetical protein
MRSISAASVSGRNCFRCPSIFLSISMQDSHTLKPFRVGKRSWRNRSKRGHAENSTGTSRYGKGPVPHERGRQKRRPQFVTSPGPRHWCVSGSRYRPRPQPENCSGDRAGMGTPAREVGCDFCDGRSSHAPYRLNLLAIAEAGMNSANDTSARKTMLSRIVASRKAATIEQF